MAIGPLRAVQARWRSLQAEIEAEERRAGDYAMPFSTAGMCRGYMGRDGQPRVEIWC